MFGVSVPIAKSIIPANAGTHHTMKGQNMPRAQNDTDFKIRLAKSRLRNDANRRAAIRYHCGKGFNDGPVHTRPPRPHYIMTRN